MERLAEQQELSVLPGVSVVRDENATDLKTSELMAGKLKVHLYNIWKKNEWVSHIRRGGPQLSQWSEHTSQWIYSRQVGESFEDSFPALSSNGRQQRCWGAQAQVWKERWLGGTCGSWCHDEGHADGPGTGCHCHDGRKGVNDSADGINTFRSAWPEEFGRRWQVNNIWDCRQAHLHLQPFPFGHTWGRTWAQSSLRSRRRWRQWQRLRLRRLRTILTAGAAQPAASALKAN